MTVEMLLIKIECTTKNDNNCSFKCLNDFGIFWSSSIWFLNILQQYSPKIPIPPKEHCSKYTRVTLFSEMHRKSFKNRRFTPENIQTMFQGRWIKDINSVKWCLHFKTSVNGSLGDKIRYTTYIIYHISPIISWVMSVNIGMSNICYTIHFLGIYGILPLAGPDSLWS